MRKRVIRSSYYKMSFIIKRWKNEFGRNMYKVECVLNGERVDIYDFNEYFIDLGEMFYAFARNDKNVQSNMKQRLYEAAKNALYHKAKCIKSFRYSMGYND